MLYSYGLVVWEVCNVYTYTHFFIPTKLSDSFTPPPPPPLTISNISRCLSADFLLKQMILRRWWQEQHAPAVRVLDPQTIRQWTPPPHTAPPHIVVVSASRSVFRHFHIVADFIVCGQFHKLMFYCSPNWTWGGGGGGDYLFVFCFVTLFSLFPMSGLFGENNFKEE